MKGTLTKTINGWKGGDPRTEEALKSFPLGAVVNVTMRQPRNAAHHRKAMALLQLVYDNQETYPSFDALLDDVKLKCGHYKKHVNYKLDKETGEFVESVMFFPRSISFGSMDQSAFATFYDKMYDVVLNELLPGLNRSELEQAVLDFESNWQAA